MTALGSPQRAFRAIHVVGTNGKSSTVRMTAALLAHHGVRTGAYLSPHLVSFAERIRIDGEDVSEDEFAAAVARARGAAAIVDRTLDEDDRVTQFEALTAAAYAELAQAGVEVAVVEAGLGGRWDATNVIDAEVVVLTNVGLEHTRWLGPTVRDIAREKLAVVRRPARARPHARARRRPASRRRGRGARRRGAPERDDRPRPGRAAAGGRDARPRRLPATQLRRRLRRGRGAARPPGPRCRARGRCLDARAGPLRGAAARRRRGRGRARRRPQPRRRRGARGLAAGVRRRPPLVAVVSVLDDKDAAAMLGALLPLCAGAVFTANANPRALSPATLASLAGQVGGGRGRGSRASRPTRAARSPSRASSPVRAASSSRRARSTSSPTSCAPPAPAAGSML